MKVEALFEACVTNEQINWIKQHQESINAFRGKVTNYFESIRQFSNNGSLRSARSVRSRKSASSSASSARVSLALKKAKILTEKSVLSKATELENEEILMMQKILKIKKEKRQNELERQTLDNEILEQELNMIDEQSIHSECAASIAGSDCGGERVMTFVDSPRVLGSKQLVAYWKCRQGKIKFHKNLFKSKKRLRSLSKI